MADPGGDGFLGGDPALLPPGAPTRVAAREEMAELLARWREIEAAEPLRQLDWPDDADDDELDADDRLIVITGVGDDVRRRVMTSGELSNGAAP